MPRKHIIKSDPYTACTNKIAYPDEHAARVAALDAHVVLGRPLRPYRCPHCTGWHLSKRNMGE